MDRFICFQVSLFGEFADIRPNNGIFLQLLSNLQEEAFIPSTVNQAVLDAGTGKVKMDSRMRMVSQDEEWSINFLGERIDFNYNNNSEETRSFKKVDDLYGYIKNLMDKVYPIFTDVIGNRIAFNGKAIMNEMTDEQIRDFMSAFSTPLSIYNDKDLTEWSVKFNEQKKLEWGDKSEICNCITEISRFVGEGGSKTNRVLLSVDVNTVRSNTINRFTYEDILGFSEEARNLSDLIISEIEGK
jgi:hypothetical protein